MIISLLTKSREGFKVMPTSDTSEDRNKARIAESILDANFYLNNEQLNKELFVKLGVLTGTAYRKDYWDSTEKCLKTKILSALQIIPDLQNGIENIDEGNFVMEFGFHPISKIKDLYNKEGKEYTGLAKDITENDNKNLQLRYLQKLQNNSGDDAGPSNHVLVLETYIKPNKKYKKGLIIISTDKEILYISENNSYAQFKKYYTPYSEYKFKLDLFSAHGISLPELIIPLNKDINKIDSLLMLNRATMASPKFLVPYGSLLPDQFVDGRPGQRIDYKETGRGDKPSFEYGKPLDNSVLQERQQRVQDITTMSGTNEILRGIRPQGVSTAAGLNLLLEQSYSKFDNIVARLEFSMSKAYTKVLNLIKYYYSKNDSEYIKKLRAFNSNSTKVAIDDFFKDGNIGNNIDVRVVPGSMMPKSQVMEQNNIKEVAAMGVFGVLDPVQNPIGNKYFLSKFNLDNFKTPTNDDATRANWENDLIRNGEFDEVEVMPVDDNVIHFKVLNQEIKKPDFYDNNSQKIVDYFFELRLF